jgi:hypothetical protein
MFVALIGIKADGRVGKAVGDGDEVALPESLEAFLIHNPRRLLPDRVLSQCGDICVHALHLIHPFID